MGIRATDLRIVLSVTGSDALILSLEGDVDLATGGTLAEAIRTALNTRPSRLVVDLEKVSFLDSTGIRVLIVGWKIAAGRSTSFHLVNLQPAVRRVLEMTGVLDVLTGQP